MPRKKMKHETHGALPLEQAKSVYEIMGYKEHVFQWKNIEDYLAYLNKLNLSDLQEHAISMGSIPIDDRSRMTDKLVREYGQKMGGLNSAFGATDKNFVDKNQLPENVKRVLNKGK